MNNLQFETSPYLLQHQTNPVNWYAWNNAALKKAKNENKLLLISVGYAACHWCHVMEHESFEDEEVAHLMNASFVSVKVDREERPDIDQIYMNAAMITTGQGGWPLNIIALPNGKPIYAGTYFPKENWIKVLNYFTELFSNQPEKLIEQAERITQGIRDMDYIPFNSSESILNESILEKIWENWRNNLDYTWGGKSGAPKFMMPNNYEYLLRYFYHSKNKTVGDAIKITLKKMAFGGLFDVIGGGFSRYSVDIYWKVPHFEKMLYDNGQLISLYAQSFQLTKRPMYKSVVEKTVEWIEREMTDESGGLYSSLDADSEGIEGKFYCWHYNEIIELVKQCNNGFLSDEKFNEFTVELYNLTEHGNFEHDMNVLFRTEDHEYFMGKYNLSNAQFQETLNTIHKLLFEKRKAKIRPGTDDKILTEWNAIAIKGFCDAYKAFGAEHYKNKAIRTTQFILNQCKKDDYCLYRNYKNGTSSINGFLADYAFFIDALLAMHQITSDEKYLTEALHFTEYTIKHFYNKENGMFFTTSDIDEKLITRSMDSSDNVIPAANSTMAKNLLQLSKYFEKTDYEKMSLIMLNNILDSLVKNPVYYSNWAIVLDMHLHMNRELVIAGKDAQEKLKTINEYYLPNILIACAIKPSNLPLLKNRYSIDKTFLYLCKNKSCSLPFENTDEILEFIQ